MKILSRLKLVALIFLATVSLESAQADTMTPVVGGGVRLGSGDDINNNPVGYFSGKLILFRSFDRSVQFLAPGLGFQFDGTLNLSVAPIVITQPSNWAFGIDIFPFESNQDGGLWGVFVGYEFK